MRRRPERGASAVHDPRRTLATPLVASSDVMSTIDALLVHAVSKTSWIDAHYTPSTSQAQKVSEGSVEGEGIENTRSDR